MTTDIAGDDVSLRTALVEHLESVGAIRTPPWRAAFLDVPRHVFTPTVYQRTSTGWALLTPGDRQWWAAVYSDDRVVTQLDPSGVATSSSTQPRVMATMLEALDVSDGQQVLEIGTGTGYNAALLCHRLGEANVTSIDVDPVLVTQAETALAACGYRPMLIASDGRLGCPERAPFQCIIATCSVGRVPAAWLEQTTAGGVVLANIGFGTVALRLADDGAASGRFLRDGAAFIAARATSQFVTVAPGRIVELCHGQGVLHRYPPVTETLLDNAEFQFVLQLALPHLASVVIEATESCGPIRCLFDAATGSWARAEKKPNGLAVNHGGTMNLWDETLRVLTVWADAGRPPRELLGLTVTQAGTHHLWVEEPDSDQKPLLALRNCENGIETES